MKLKSFAIIIAVWLMMTNGFAVVVESIITNGLFEPYAVTVASDHNVYIADSGNHRILKYSPTTGQITTFAGYIGMEGTNDAVGLYARFSGPRGILAVSNGIYVADTYNHTIRFITYDGTVTTIAGTPGVSGFADGVGGSARFRFPQALAMDNIGNLYIADTKNNAIRRLAPGNVVSTVATGLNFPAGLAFDGTNSLWIADKLNQQIRLLDLTTANITDIAGTRVQSGSTDNIYALSAKFNNPQGILWVGGNFGLLIADSENHTVRRLYFNSITGGYSVETYLGIPGVAGRTDGSNNVATLNTPVALALDSESGGFYILDSKGPQEAQGALRRVQLFTPPPPVSAPTIGRAVLVDTENGSRTKLLPVDGLVFNNDIILAIKAEPGVETYYTFGPTPASQFDINTVPDPDPASPNSLIAPFFEEDSTTLPRSLDVTIYPDVTIKAISYARGRKPSPVVQTRIMFKTARPNVDGDNAAGFRIFSDTENAVIAYTIDGSDPVYPPTTNVSVTTNFAFLRLNITTNILFKARAYRDRYTPSETISKMFYASNNVYNGISFGFDATRNEEASSVFIAAPGQHFYVPVTLTLLPPPMPVQTIYSLQFGVTITNLTAGLPLPSIDFVSLLKKPIPGLENTFQTIPPAFYYNSDLTNTVITSNLYSSGFLGVLWMERINQTNLYNSKEQDLITYSMAHDTLFLSSSRKVVLGSLGIDIPSSAATGAKYLISLIRPSATSDGIRQDVIIDTPTNGSLSAGQMNAIKEVTVGEVGYIVGDAAPFRWFNAGDFGDGLLLNNDVVQVFQAAAYGLNTPPPDSDLFKAMDSCCISTNGTNLKSVDLFNGQNTTINEIAFGDGILDIYDVFVTYRRSVDPSTVWFARYYTPTGIIWKTQGITNIFRTGFSDLPASPAPPENSSQEQFILFTADDAIVTPGQTVDIPVRVETSGSLPLKIFLLNIAVEPLDGSPELAQPVQFIANQSIGNPSLTMSKGKWNYAGAWLNNSISGLNNGLIGTLRVTIPQTASANSAYAINFISASAGGFSKQTLNNGLLTVTAWNSSSFNDGIPDTWRLRYFGTVSNLLSQADADADGDGFSNLLEYKAGTNPVDPRSRLDVNSEKIRSGNNHQLVLRWRGATGRKYILESADSLYSANWTVVSSNITAQAGFCSFTETNFTSKTKFYRVRISE